MANYDVNLLYNIKTGNGICQCKFPPRKQNLSPGKSKVKVLHALGLLHYESNPEGHTVTKEKYIELLRRLGDAAGGNIPKMSTKQPISSARHCTCSSFVGQILPCQA
jgi:hypothetical protein